MRLASWLVFTLFLLWSSPILAEQPVDRIRQIVLHQEDSPRALANLVQLTRDLDNATSAQLFLELADDYLAQGKCNQAADFLQQLVNQHPSQPAARMGLLRLVQLYSSSEVNQAQQTSRASADEDRAITQQNFCKYALHVANNAARANPALADDPALTFQRAVAARGGGNTGVAKSLLTQLKHNRAAKPWHRLARVEQWLQEGQQGDPPLPVRSCQRAEQPPHLDGVLTDPLWQPEVPMQLAYDDEFLYFAARFAKQAGVAYPDAAGPRSHDAALQSHDHVRLRLDLDRDYATWFEFAIDHRGQTAERCWRDASWNPRWFVAAASDANSWAIEAAIPLEHLRASPLQRAAAAWAVQIERILPHTDNNALSPSAEADSPGGGFQVLVFE